MNQLAQVVRLVRAGNDNFGGQEVKVTRSSR